VVRCVPGCSKCCWDTEMVLLEEDVERIEGLGYPPSSFSYVDREGYLRLKNVDGHCVFLDPSTGRCRVYEHRPLGCRLYPVVYVEGGGVAVDPECPARHTVTDEELEEAARILPEIVERIEEERERRLSHRS